MDRYKSILPPSATLWLIHYQLRSVQKYDLNIYIKIEHLNSHSRNSIQGSKTITRDFVWDCKPSKIAYDTLIHPICKGGLKLMDFETKVKSLKAIWVKRCLESSASKWNAALYCLYKTTYIYFFLAPTNLQ